MMGLLSASVFHSLDIVTSGYCYIEDRITSLRIKILKKYLID